MAYKEDAYFISAIRITESTKGQDALPVQLQDEEKVLLEQTHGTIQLSLADEFYEGL